MMAHSRHRVSAQDCRTYFNSITNVLISDSTRYRSLTVFAPTAARTPVMPFDLIARPYS